ncbi:hypothetical protein ACJX0J_007206, partial [Zea mays]
SKQLSFGEQDRCHFTSLTFSSKFYFPYFILGYEKFSEGDHSCWGYSFLSPLVISFLDLEIPGLDQSRRRSTFYLGPHFNPGDLDWTGAPLFDYICRILALAVPKEKKLHWLTFLNCGSIWNHDLLGSHLGGGEVEIRGGFRPSSSRKRTLTGGEQRFASNLEMDMGFFWFGNYC